MGGSQSIGLPDEHDMPDGIECREGRGGVMVRRRRGNRSSIRLSRTFTFSSSRSIAETTHGAPGKHASIFWKSGNSNRDGPKVFRNVTLIRRRSSRDGIRAYWDATMQMGTLRGESCMAWNSGDPTQSDRPPDDCPSRWGL
jgi:hypothetical protein